MKSQLEYHLYNTVSSHMRLSLFLGSVRFFIHLFVITVISIHLFAIAVPSSLPFYILF